MINKVKLLRMFVKLLRARNEPCLDKLQQIYDVQQNILKRLPLEKPESKDEQWRVAAIICCEQAQEYRHMHDLERAKQCYSDALNYSPDDIEINFQVAQLYYEHHKLDFCETHCIRILNRNEHHTATTMLYADVLFRENQKDEAIKIYTDILSKHPGNVHALVRLLHMLRWVGKLNEIMPFFETYKACFKSGATEPGYNYCQGLYYWYAYRVREALVHLSQDRRDPEWGKEAVELIVHICLNPDKKTFGGEVFESQEEGTNVPPIFDGGQLMGISTAQNLLREFQPRSRASQEKVTILFNLCLIYSKELKQVESAVRVLSDMVARNVMLESSLLVAALGLLQLKQTPRARNFLKRISKSQWTPEIADDIEKSSLLLADMYIKMGKYVNAERLLDDCIRQNKSCSKAYEYKGFIMENDQRYKDAAEQYELAWKFSYCRDPAIGYRLAFSYLKYKNYTEAIDVCHQVLLEHPDYPRIQTEILNRAKLSLRP